MCGLVFVSPAEMSAGDGVRVVEAIGVGNEEASKLGWVHLPAG